VAAGLQPYGTFALIAGVFGKLELFFETLQKIVLVHCTRSFERALKTAL
jgi:hypothetical protein